MADVQPGTNVTVAVDILVEGVLTFAAGEQVTVQQVAPNPQRPEYKYTVFSAKTNKWFMLRDADIMAQPAAYAPPPIPPQQQAPFAQPQQPGAPRPPRPAGAGGGVDFSGMELSDWLVAGGGLFIFISIFFYFVGYGFLSILTGLGLVVLVVLDKIVKVPQISEWQGLTWVYIIFGGVSTLLGFLGLMSLLFLLHGFIAARWYIAPFLELLASVAVLIGGIMRYKEEH